MLGKVLVGVMFGGVGAWLAYQGIAGFIRARRFVSGASTTRGTVVAYETMVSEWNDEGVLKYITFHFPIVQFTDAEGIPRRVKTSTGCSPESFPVGSEVTVVYSRDDPARAEVSSSARQLWATHAAVTGGGMILLVITAAVWVFNVPFSTPLDRWIERAPVPAEAPAPSPAKKSFAGPIVIREAQPYLATIGVPITLLGSNFGRPEDHRVSIGGHGMSVSLEVLKWENDSVTVRIPGDPRILPDRSYYYRIERRGSPVESSNLFMFGFETTK